MADLRSILLGYAQALGAHLAGIAAVDDLRDAHEVVWPEGALSVLVVAVSHPPDRPEMDWWFGRSDPPGNKILAGIVQALCDRIPSEFGVRAVHLPYHVDRGGTYLKDAAVLAGVGRIGLNNLLLTPHYGPRVRLRALTLDVALQPTGPALFDPCADCAAPCREACPQNAFMSNAKEGGIPVNRSEELRSAGWVRLPARDGRFSRAACMRQMNRDLETAAAPDTDLSVIEPDAATGAPAASAVEVEAAASAARASDVSATDAAAAAATGATFTVAGKVVRYCRACELSCPVGTSAARP